MTEQAEWETHCPVRTELFEIGEVADGSHCNCWYDGNPCCACGDPKLKEEKNDENK